MPGYGYAKVSKQQKGVWDHLIRSYLLGRTSLKRACVLIDARRGVMDKDEAFMDLLDANAGRYKLVLTKTDTIAASELRAVLTSTEKAIKSHVAAHQQLVATSAETKEGIDTLQEQLLPFALVKSDPY